MEARITCQCYRRHGSSSPQTLKLFEDEVEPKELTDILTRVYAVALNYRDANILTGTNPRSVSPNGIPCSAGTVIAIGCSVTWLAIGDKVYPIFDQNSVTGLEQSVNGWEAKLMAFLLHMLSSLRGRWSSILDIWVGMKQLACRAPAWRLGMHWRMMGAWWRGRLYWFKVITTSSEFQTNLVTYSNIFQELVE